MIVVNMSSPKLSLNSFRLLQPQDRRLKSLSEGDKIFGFILLATVVLAWCFGPVRRHYCCPRADDAPTPQIERENSSQEFEKSQEPVSIESRREALIELFERCKVLTVRFSIRCELIALTWASFLILSFLSEG